MAKLYLLTAGLVCLAEIFFIFALGGFPLWLIAIHGVSMLIALGLSKSYPLQDLADFFARIRSGEPIVREYLEESLIRFAIILLYIPGVLCHCMAITLLIPRVRSKWVANLFYSSI